MLNIRAWFRLQKVLSFVASSLCSHLNVKQCFGKHVKTFVWKLSGREGLNCSNVTFTVNNSFYYLFLQSTTNCPVQSKWRLYFFEYHQVFLNLSRHSKVWEFHQVGLWLFSDYMGPAEGEWGYDSSSIASLINGLHEVRGAKGPKLSIVEMVLYNMAAMLASFAAGYDVRISNNTFPIHPRLQPDR